MMEFRNKKAHQLIYLKWKEDELGSSLSGIIPVTDYTQTQILFYDLAVFQGQNRHHESNVGQIDVDHFVIC